MLQKKHKLVCGICPANTYNAGIYKIHATEKHKLVCGICPVNTYNADIYKIHATEKNIS